MSGAQPAQLVFDLSLPPALGPEDFVVAACNAEAVAWLLEPRPWPGPVLALHGPPGSGKSHLLGLWRQRTGAATRLDAPGRDLALDDAAVSVTGPVAEEALFHRINRAREEGGRILLAAAEPPARWPVTLPDLASRLRAAMVVGVSAPDEAFLSQLLVKLIADRQLVVGPEAVAYLVPRMERSFAAARRLVATIDRLSLAAGRRVTLPLVRAALAEAGGAAGDTAGEAGGDA